MENKSIKQNAIVLALMIIIGLLGGVALLEGLEGEIDVNNAIVEQHFEAINKGGADND